MRFAIKAIILSCLTSYLGASEFTEEHEDIAFYCSLMLICPILCSVIIFLHDSK